jgi:hypothetical protein
VNQAAITLMVVGYPVAIVVIARWVPVVRERRTTWFAAHTAAVAAIVAAWVIEGRAATVAVNATWLVVSIAWYLVDPAARMRARSR